jgi:hypothetical protein
LQLGLGYDLVQSCIVLQYYNSTVLQYILTTGNTTAAIPILVIIAVAMSLQPIVKLWLIVVVAARCRCCHGSSSSSQLVIIVVAIVVVAVTALVIVVVVTVLVAIVLATALVSRCHCSSRRCHRRISCRCRHWLSSSPSSLDVPVESHQVIIVTLRVHLRKCGEDIEIK